MSERADLDKAATEFERQAGLAQFQIAHSRERNRESADHSDYIQDLPDRIGSRNIHRLKRLLQAGNMRKYSEQAEERAKELESVLAHVEKHRRETEAKIDVYISQAQKGANAINDSTTRQNSCYGILAQAGI